ncbi:hypothetical protein G9P44_001646 [Scheffersomyces stipitis]|nr:hypothetical protein G9P44_001646 [Scheffersomyces stipitis]
MSVQGYPKEFEIERKRSRLVIFMIPPMMAICIICVIITKYNIDELSQVSKKLEPFEEMVTKLDQLMSMLNSTSSSV